MDERGYENWVDMKKSITYKSLGILEGEGYVRGERKKDYKTSKKTYYITKKGSEKAHEQVKLCITNAPTPKSMFDLGLSGLPLLTRSEALKVLEEYKYGESYAMKMFEEEIDDLDNVDVLVETNPDQKLAGSTVKGHFENKEMIFIVKALFERPYRIIKAQYEWLEEFIQSIKEDKGEFRFKGE